MNCLRSLERWGHGFESHSRHGCLRLFCVFVGDGLATGWSPVQGVLPTVLGLRNWSETRRFTDALSSKVGATGKRERKRYYFRILKHLYTCFRECSWLFSITNWTRCSFLEGTSSALQIQSPYRCHTAQIEGVFTHTKQRQSCPCA
jgi:hypothetical protein